jgi:two-component system LytT family response regulator
MSTRRPLRAYLVDDIEAANLRLARVLEETGRVEVVGTTTQPLLALAEIPERDVDVLFLDIEMPGLDGFELLRRLPVNPQVVFVTGHDEYARRAFDERAVDYLMKPVVPDRLAQALDTLEAGRADPEREVLGALLERLEGYQPRHPPVPYVERVKVELGQGGFDVIEVVRISHFVKQGRGTLAMTEQGARLVDHALGELESRLNPRDFYRIQVRRLEPPRSGALVVKLKDEAGTELEVARERIRELRQRFF